MHSAYSATQGRHFMDPVTGAAAPITGATVALRDASGREVVWRWTRARGADIRIARTRVGGRAVAGRPDATGGRPAGGRRLYGEDGRGQQFERRTDATGFGDTRRAVGAGHLFYFSRRGHVSLTYRREDGIPRVPLGVVFAGLAGATTFNLRLDFGLFRPLVSRPLTLHMASGFPLRL